MWKGRNLFFKIGIIAVLIIVIIVALQQPVPATDGTVVFNNGTTFFVMIADSDTERQQGLSGRKSLGQHEGMLFVFDIPAQHRFWMKDMNFPIDIVWIDSNFTVVDITHSLSPNTFPQAFAPTLPAQYVLEIPAGSAEKFGITVGQVLVFEK